MGVHAADIETAVDDAAEAAPARAGRARRRAATARPVPADGTRAATAQRAAPRQAPHVDRANEEGDSRELRSARSTRSTTWATSTCGSPSRAPSSPSACYHVHPRRRQPRQGFNYGLEFKSGTRIAVTFVKAGASVARCAACCRRRATPTPSSSRSSPRTAARASRSRPRCLGRPAAGAQEALDKQFSIAPQRRHRWNINTVGATFGREVITARRYKAVGIALRPHPDLRLVPLLSGSSPWAPSPPSSTTCWS